MQRLLPLMCVVALVITGCKNEAEDEPDHFWTPDSDWDGDGWVAAMDCNDFDATVNSEGTEHCFNGLDDDCNGQVDCLDAACEDSPLCILPEDCDNGIDDDEDTFLDCDDIDCYFADYCSDCRGYEAATCWEPDSGSVTSGSDTAEFYTCGPAAPGVEFVYEFVAPASGNLEIWVDPEDKVFTIGGVDAAIYVMEAACRVDACIAFVNDFPIGEPETLQFPVEAATHYFIAIEKLNAGITTGTGFDIEFRCLE